MSNYPRAWALWFAAHKRWSSTLYNTDPRSIHDAVSGDRRYVELISLPEHESIVAAAVAAERERCAGIADAVARALMTQAGGWIDNVDGIAIDTASAISAKIREVPE